MVSKYMMLNLNPRLHSTFTLNEVEIFLGDNSRNCPFVMQVQCIYLFNFSDFLLQTQAQEMELAQH